MNTLNEFTCVLCGEKKEENKFYKHYTNKYYNNRVPYCILCVQKQCLDKFGEYSPDGLSKVLMEIDRPFFKSTWDSAITKPNVISEYFKLIGMKQHKDKCWEDGDKIEGVIENNFIPTTIDLDMHKMRLKWGEKYEKDDYYKLEKFYNEMKIVNNITTPQDLSYLEALTEVNFKFRKAVTDGASNAKQLGDLFTKLMSDLGLRATDKTDADKTSGMVNFSNIYAEVEKDSFIPPWEKFRKIKGLTQDFADKTIMYILNYYHKLNNVSQLTKPTEDTPKLEDDEKDIVSSMVEFDKQIVGDILGD